jgi:hypothetical protein
VFDDIGDIKLSIMENHGLIIKDWVGEKATGEGMD